MPKRPINNDIIQLFSPQVSKTRQKTRRQQKRTPIIGITGGTFISNFGQQYQSKHTECLGNKHTKPLAMFKNIMIMPRNMASF